MPTLPAEANCWRTDFTREPTDGVVVEVPSLSLAALAAVKPVASAAFSMLSLLYVAVKAASKKGEAGPFTGTSDDRRRLLLRVVVDADEVPEESDAPDADRNDAETDLDDDIDDDDEDDEDRDDGTLGVTSSAEGRCPSACGVRRNDDESLALRPAPPSSLPELVVTDRLLASANFVIVNLKSFDAGSLDGGTCAGATALRPSLPTSPGLPLPVLSVLLSLSLASDDSSPSPSIPRLAP